MTFDPVLAIMNPRNITECVHAFERLDVRRAWLSRYTEAELRSVIASIVDDEAIPFSHLAIVADDCIVEQDALDAVFELARSQKVATGYCRLASGHPRVNVTRRPVIGDTPSPGAYDFYKLDEVRSWPREAVPTGFVGFAITVMPREMWRRFPFGVFAPEAGGHASDFHLSARLRDAGVPMRAAREGYIEHVKTEWNMRDHAPGRELLVGREPARVVVN
jgi:GT2 family glycosyltransferase